MGDGKMVVLVLALIMTLILGVYLNELAQDVEMYNELEKGAEMTFNVISEGEEYQLCELYKTYKDGTDSKKAIFYVPDGVDFSELDEESKKDYYNELIADKSKSTESKTKSSRSSVIYLYPIYGALYGY